MVPVTELKPGQWLALEDAQKIFPGLHRKTVYNWRAAMKCGRVPIGHFPRSIGIGGTTYIHALDFRDYINRELAMQAS